jgi:FKBP-type peptidyl-prolyl cis-trans isomerase
MRLTLVTGTVLVVTACGAAAERRSSLDSQKDRLSYAVGVEMSQDLKREGVEIDMDLVARGLKDGLSGKKLLLTETDLRDTVSAFQNARKQKQAEAGRAAAEDNRKRGEAFLAENAKKPGVVTLPSGLQYEILKPGDGRRPTDSDTVECHYRGTLIDGAEIDSSYRRSQPLTVPVRTVIPGWKEALKLMPVGSKWKLFVPSRLAYGEQGIKSKSGRTIAPNAALVFEVELLGIKRAPTGKQQTASAAVLPGAE